jgi:LacI family transcriptional regulator
LTTGNIEQSILAKPREECEILDRLREESVAGVIIWQNDGIRSEAALRRLHDAKVPVVYIDRHPVELDCDCVGVDNRESMRAAIEHLLCLGHRRIGYITGAERVNTVVEREQGYRDALCAAGIRSAEDMIVTLHEGPGGDIASAVRRLYALEDRPSAVAALSDFHAFAFMREARLLGWSVPDDVSVIGFDDIECYSPHLPVLTTVHQPFSEIGERAAHLLVRRLETGPDSARQHIMLPTSLVIRSTCRSVVSDGSVGKGVVAVG